MLRYDFDIVTFRNCSGVLSSCDFTVKKVGIKMNNKIKTVAVLGAGAVGAYVIYGLKDTYEENLWVIAEGERGERLKTDGLVINGIPYRLNVKSPKDARGADLLVVCLKYGALADALPDIREVAGANTTIISLMNGVDSEDTIAQVIPREQIIHALIRIASQHKGNQITFPLPEKNMGIFYGIPKVPASDEGGQDALSDGRMQRLEALRDCLGQSKMVTHLSNDILKEIWKKYAMNISFNIPQAILSAGAGVYRDSAHASFLSEALCDEVVLLAGACGIDIRTSEILSGSSASSIPKSSRYSTLQDLDAKRATEIDMFCGTVMRLGQEKGIAVPYNTFAYHVIKGLEERNEGKFDY